VQYRPLGDTGLRVSVLGLGAANLGGVYGAVDERAAIATVQRAFDLGVNVFDSAPYYGATRAETVLGKALRRLPRDQIVVMGKCGRFGVDDFDFSPSRIARSVDDSLQRLQVQHLDVCQLHDVEFGDLDSILGVSLPALHALKRSGKVRYCGITGLPLRIFAAALSRRAPLDTALSYCHATLFDDSLLALLPAFAAAGIGVVNASPAAMGLLSSHGPRDWHPASAAVRERCRAAAAHCAARGVELAELALQYSCSLDRIATTLCGTAAPAEIAANVAAVQRPIDAELLAEVQAILRPIRGATWRQGRPENN
jgi:aryl-alcohol dehydrogenase-like predicted oxidoreductase